MSTRRLVSVLVAVTTATLNWFAFYWIAVKLGSHAPGFTATAVLVSVVVHEIGHLIVMERHGIMTHLVFLVALGGAVPDAGSHKRFKDLNWNSIAAISLAGIMGNVAVGLAGAVLYYLGSFTAAQLSAIVNLNGVLIFSNLIPFGIFDGGRFAKVFFDSVPEREDHSYLLRVGLVLIVVAFVLMFIFRRDIITMTWLVLWGLSFRSTHDDTLGSKNPKAMTRMQQVRWAIAYTLFVCIGMAMVAATPPWL